MRGLLCLLLALNLFALLGNLLREGNAQVGGGGGGFDAPILNGDANGDGGRDISDAVYMLNWLFIGGQEPVACDCGAPLRETICDDGIDNDGDGDVDARDDDCAVVEDNDQDGFAANFDCDDANPDVHPGAPENCHNEIDDDCDTLVDAADTLNCDARETNCDDSIDNDGDGAIDGADSDCPQVIDRDQDGFPAGSDCDDLDATINPAAVEICNNSIDDDCDGGTDLGDVDCNDGRD